jgi:MFS family permease
MLCHDLPVTTLGFLQEAKRYVQRVGMLSRNARLYLVATALQGLSFGMWGVIFNLYLNLKEVGFQPDFIGNMFTVSAIATGIIALPAGLFCERFGPKKAVIISLTSNIVGLALILLLQPSILLLASFTTGLIGTIGSVAGAPFMMENSEKEERTYLFSIDWATMIIMGVVGNYAGGALPDFFNARQGLPAGAEVGSPFGYRITLAISLALALASVIPLWLVREKKTERQKVGTLLSLKNIRSPGIIVKFMVPTALIGFGAGFIVPLFNIFFKLKLAATAEQIGIISAMGSVTLGIGTLAAPILSNRIGKVKSIVLCEFLSIPFIMLITVSPNLILASAAYTVRGALMNMAGPISTTLQMEMVSETERATTSGFMIMADNIPRAATASISGEMMTGNDFWTPFLITTITYLVASSLFLVFFRKAEKENN